MKGSARSSRPSVSPTPAISEAYAGFAQIDGTHSYKEAVPGGFVDYQVRRRGGGKISFFNFDLAKDMGLIAPEHPHRLNAALGRKVLDTFALVIINEWDIQNKRRFPKEDVKPNRYMATRYLQLQHPTKRGRTSGDGRGIWNGQFKARGKTWDVSSSGTGATCLSPAVAKENKFFKTGDREVCYGNGYNSPAEGFSAGILSEIFHRNGISTERTLAILEFPGGSAITVRAAPNLLRPSHFFCHLKQNNLERLKASVDLFIQRQIGNGVWTFAPKGSKAYENFAIQMAQSFARLAAQFESEYVFCWLDWDGDNVLADAGIIDYGSVRQFGLFHDQYRYDDQDRYSTKLSEQRLKARYLVQVFAQIRSFLVSGHKRNLRRFRADPLLKLFDRTFETAMDEFLLRKMGFSQSESGQLMHNHRGAVSAFRKVFAHFERVQAGRGIHKVADGISSDAVFCMRTALRELPKRYLESDQRALEAREFVQMLRSGYASRRDLRITPHRQQRVREYQERYLELVRLVTPASGSPDRTLLKLIMRASQFNRADRITGDGVVHATDAILRRRKTWTQAQMQALVERFIHTQVMELGPQDEARSAPARQMRGTLKQVTALVEELSESL